jgi:hypothetical protein
MNVSVLGFGAAEIGFQNSSDKTVSEILSKASAAGVNVIDTAAMYSESEKKIGRALRNQRNRFLLFTKCGLNCPPRRSTSGLSLRVGRLLQQTKVSRCEHQSVDWHPRSLKWNIDQSLRHLKTDWIDLIQLHSCSEETLRQGEAIDVLQRARAAGKVRYIGYSGDGGAAVYAILCGAFDALQTSVNIADQEALNLTMPIARHRQIGVIAKRPIANGLWTNTQRPASDQNHAYWERFQDLRYAFLQGREAFEKALRFTLSVPGVSTAIVGTTDIEHFNQNIRFAEAGKLNDEEFQALRDRWKEIAKPNWVGQV